MVFLIIFKSDYYKKFCNSFFKFFTNNQEKIVVHNDTGSSTKAKDVTNKETRTTVDHEKKSEFILVVKMCREVCY